MAPHRVEHGSHLVHFYADDDVLAAAVAEYVAEGLHAGEHAVLIAEPSHLSAMRAALQKLGIDPDGGACGIHLLDSAATLERFMKDGRPTRERFTDVVGGVLHEASLGSSGVRAYGEMVATLWRGGNVTAAITLEELWNELAGALNFSLYCGYAEALLTDSADEAALDETCRLHSAVIGEGAFASLSSTSRSFAAATDAPAAARAFVHSTLAAVGDAALADDVALVVSELATNALVHGGSAFSVVMTSLSRTVRVAVRDQGSGNPVLRHASPADRGGRGLHIIDAISNQWGTSCGRSGKIVWAELPRRPGGPPQPVPVKPGGWRTRGS